MLMIIYVEQERLQAAITKECHLKNIILSAVFIMQHVQTANYFMMTEQPTALAIWHTTL